MNFTKKELEKHTNCKSYYIIDYVHANGKGHMEVKTTFYDQYEKKFLKLFKDVKIISFLKETRV